MPSKNSDWLDDAIDGALRSEALRPVPSSLHRNLGRRVRVVAMANAERRIFRRRMAAAGALLVFIGVSSWAVAVVGDLEGIIQATVPGALGYYDYWSVTFAQWGWGIVAATVAGTCVLGAACYLIERRIYQRAIATR